MFCILAPTFNHNSAGIVALYKLYGEITAQKIPCMLLEYAGIGDNFQLVTANRGRQDVAFLKTLDVENIIFIVPEVLSTSQFPTNARIARYFLNRLGAIWPATVRSDEFKITSNPIFVDDYDFHLPQYLGKLKLDKLPNTDQKRIINSTYFGKSHARYQNAGPLPTSILITRQWPQDFEDYLSILALSDHLFSFDACSSTNQEAILSGAKLVILDFETISKELLDSSFNPMPYLTRETYTNPDVLFDYAEKKQTYILNLKMIDSQFPSEVEELARALNIFFSRDSTYDET